jgi:hypothetical protein
MGRLTQSSISISSSHHPFVETTLEVYDIFPTSHPKLVVADEVGFEVFLAFLNPWVVV